MQHIENLSKIWNNGTTSPASFSVEETEKFKKSTGATKVIGARWTYDRKEIEVPFYVRLLKDKTGVAHFQDDDMLSNKIVVRNGDGSVRTVIGVPKLSDASVPEKGYLSLPPSSAHWGGIEWGCEGNDGKTDYLFDFDWNSGQLLRYVRPPLPW